MASRTSFQSLDRQAGASGGAMPLGSAPLPWGEAAEKRAARETAGAISAEVVGLLRRHTGGGSTRARTLISSDLVVVMLSDCHGELLARAHTVVYDGIRAEATAVVEELTGGQVSAYLTARHDEPDLAILVFYLAAPPLRLA